MARTNVGKSGSGLAWMERTHEGAPAYTITDEQRLRRSVLSCFLFEGEFYEDGQTIAARIAELVPNVAPEKVAALAVEARDKMYLRHAPLYLVREMARHTTHRSLVRATLAHVIQRADELAEFLALYWGAADKRTLKKDRPLAKSVQKGLADAFVKFDAYRLAKYNRDNPITLRDVLFLSHAEPKDDAQAALWKQLIDGSLPSPDTWEVELSAGKDKQATWTRLLTEKKLGGMALIRNLRNMVAANVDDALIRTSLRTMKAQKILPFRFLAAVNAAKTFATELEAAMLTNLEDQASLSGMTILVVDVSGSMMDKLSGKSDLRRVDAAAGLAVCARELCQSVRVFAFGSTCQEVPAYRGLALADYLAGLNLGGTDLGRAMQIVNGLPCDRVIVITDEQSHTRVGGPKNKGYLINVASNKSGVGYGPWVHIDGFSERTLDYVRAIESERA